MHISFNKNCNLKKAWVTERCLRMIVTNALQLGSFSSVHCYVMHIILYPPINLLIQFTFNSSFVCKNWLQKSNSGQFFVEFEASVVCFIFSIFLACRKFRSSDPLAGSLIPLAWARRAINSEI